MRETLIRTLSRYWPVIVLVTSLWVSFKEQVNGILVICVGLAVYAVLNARQILSQRNVRVSYIDFGILLLAVFELVALCMSSFSFNSWPFLLYLSQGLLTYFFVRFTYKDKDQFILTFWGVAGIGLYWGLMTLKKAHWMMGQISSHGFTDLSQFRNGYSPLTGSNEWTLFLLLLLPFVTVLCLTARRLLLRIAAGGIAMIIAYCILLGFSRGGYIALATYTLIVAFGGFLFVRKIFPRLLIYLLIASVFFGVAVYKHWPPVRTTLMMNETVSQQRSTESRWRMWDVGKATLKTHPWFGVGAYNFPFQYNAVHQRTIDEAPLGRVTSVVTQLITEKGILGFAEVICVLLFILINGIRALMAREKIEPFSIVFVVATLAALTALCIRELTVSTLLFRGFIFQLFAILMSFLLVTTKTTWKSWNIPRWKYLLMQLPLALLLFMTLCTALLTEYASRRHGSALHAFTTASYDRSIKTTEKVAAKLPAHPILEFHKSIAIAQCGRADSITWENMFQCSGDVSTALKFLDKAISLEPRDETLKFAKGWMLASDDQWPAAFSTFKTPYRIDPTISAYPLAMGIVSERAGNIDTAMAYYAKAMFLDPDLFLSQFYREFTTRHPESGDTLLVMAKAYFDEATAEPISTGRFGALLYFNEEYPLAEKYLQEAMDALPGMNRPYFYLGAIALSKGDTARTLDLWDKSHTLDGYDQLVNWKYGFLLSDLKTPEASKVLTQTLKPRTGEPFQQKRRIFYPKLSPHANATFSEQMMRYINPYVDLREIEERIDSLND